MQVTKCSQADTHLYWFVSHQSNSDQHFDRIRMLLRSLTFNLPLFSPFVISPSKLIQGTYGLDGVHRLKGNHLQKDELLKARLLPIPKLAVPIYHACPSLLLQASQMETGVINFHLGKKICCLLENS